MAGKRYHAAVVSGKTGTNIYLTNITDGGASVRDATNSVPYKDWQYTASWGARQFGGSGYTFTGGGVDEFAIFYGQRYSGSTYTPPSAPYVGNEANIVGLYHFEGNLNSAIGG